MRSDRASGSWLRTFRRLRSVSLDADFSRWSRWSQTGQPLTPGHYCPPALCAPEADHCDAAFETPRPAGCSHPPTHVHAALARYPGQPWRMLMVNPGQSRRRWGLRVHLSGDEGSTWPMSRRLVPDNQATGYSAVAVLTTAAEPEIAVLFERSDGGRHSLSFVSFTLEWLLCSRTEPLYIGGNPWLGPFRAVDQEADTPTFTGTSAGEPLVVRSALSHLSAEVTRVEVIYGSFQGEATAHPERPGTLRLSNGRDVHIDRWDPEVCRASSNSPTSTSRRNP